jgi:regulator of PEP synthase PpsR (kinase-PPPase family)
MKAKAAPGRQHELDQDYFDRVEAVNYTIAHDDGANTIDLEDADVVLVGVSRTSKTPTCVYLSYRGLAAANVPFVKGCPLPDSLFSLKKPLVVGLVISPDRLEQIRKSRLLSLKEDRETSYVDIDKIKEEVIEARKLFLKYKWPVLDVTRKSVEETTAIILQMLTKHREVKDD